MGRKYSDEDLALLKEFKKNNKGSCFGKLVGFIFFLLFIFAIFYSVNLYFKYNDNHKFKTLVIDTDKKKGDELHTTPKKEISEEKDVENKTENTEKTEINKDNKEEKVKETYKHSVCMLTESNRDTGIVSIEQYVVNFKNSDGKLNDITINMSVDYTASGTTLSSTQKSKLESDLKKEAKALKGFTSTFTHKGKIMKIILKGDYDAFVKNFKDDLDSDFSYSNYVKEMKKDGYTCS